MKAQFKSLVAAKKGKYAGFDFSYQGEPFKGQVKEPVTRFIFSNADFLPILRDCALDDWLELSFEKKGQYTNLVGVVKIAGPVMAAAPAKEFKSYRNEDPETQLRIARSVALKASVDYCVTMPAKDKTVENILSVAREFEAYLTLQEASQLGMSECDGNPFEG